MPAGKALTLVEVARRLGVSKSTVSAAFTGRGTISANRRDSVRTAARELGYEPNPYAQRLVDGANADMVCLYVPGAGSPAGGRVMDAIQSYLVDRGISAPIYIAGKYLQDIDYHVSVLRGLRLQRPRAIVAALRNLAPELRAELERYRDAGGILIGVDGYEQEDMGSDWVRFDRKHSAHMAASYLIEQGHNRIGFYSSTPSSRDLAPGENPFYDGFVAAHTDAGLTVRPEWQISGAAHEPGGMDLAKRFLEMTDRPTGYFIIDDSAASAFIQQLVRRGVNVPGTVSVIGLDDIPAAEACIVPITTLKWPVAPMVDNVLQLLNSRLDGTYIGCRREIIVRAELRIRESCRSNLCGFTR